MPALTDEEPTSKPKTFMERGSLPEGRTICAIAVKRQRLSKSMQQHVNAHGACTVDIVSLVDLLGRPREQAPWAFELFQLVTGGRGSGTFVVCFGVSGFSFSPSST